MKITILSSPDRLYELADEIFNPPSDPHCEDFKNEIGEKRRVLGELLQAIGNEGDFYGVSDFAIRPGSRGPFNNSREFHLVLLKKKVEKTDYLDRIWRFILDDAQNYRVWIDQDYDPELQRTVLMGLHEVFIYCNNEKELNRIQDLVRKTVQE